jgi:hypothetical protein
MSDATNCAWCGKPKAEHGPGVDWDGRILCNIPGVTSQSFTPLRKPEPPTTLLTWLPGGAQGAYPVFERRTYVVGMRIAGPGSIEQFPTVRWFGEGEDTKGDRVWEYVLWYAVLDVTLPVPGEGTVR